MNRTLIAAIAVLAANPPACSGKGSDPSSGSGGVRGGTTGTAVGASESKGGGGETGGGGGTAGAGSPTGGNGAGGASTSNTWIGAGGLWHGGGVAWVGGASGASGTPSEGGSGNGGTHALGGQTATAGGALAGSNTGRGGTLASGGAGGKGGTGTTGAAVGGGGATGIGGSRTGGQSSPATGGSGGAGGAGATTSGGTSCAGPIGTFSGPVAKGIAFTDDRGKPVNAHGGGIIKQGDTYYMHGEYFLDTTTDNNFNGFSMYSSKDLATWKWERMVLPQQPSGLLGPKRKGERPHIVKCPSTGEFVLYAHAASEDYQTDKEVVYATSPTVNGEYTLVGALTNSSGTTAAHSDMSAMTDGNTAYVLTESGHVYTLAADCHSWLSDKTYSTVNGDSGGSESPTVFKAGSTYYWIGSYKTGWRANNNFYSTAPALAGPWTFQGFIAPVKDTSTTTPSGQPNPPKWISDERTWLSQSTWVTPVEGCSGTVYVFWGDHWFGTEDTSNPGKHNAQATHVFQPLVFDGIKIFMPTYHETWKLDVGAGTWSP
jgi:hypothetical protein